MVGAGLRDEIQVACSMLQCSKLSPYATEPLHSAGMDVMIVLHTYLHGVRPLFRRILDN